MKTSHLLLLIAVTVIWGLNFVVIKVGLQSFPPLLFSALRFAIAAFPICLFVPRPKIGWSLIVGIGMTLCVTKFSLLFIAMDRGLSPGLASLLLQSQALFTLLFAWFLMGERPSPIQRAGSALSSLGLLMIAFDTGGSVTGSGLLLALGAAAAWALANLLMRNASGSSMLAIIVWASVVAPVPLLLLSVLFEGWDRDIDAIRGLGIEGLGALAYVGYGATIIGFAIWGTMIRTYGASKVAPFSLLVPVTGMASSMALTGEGFGPMRLAAAVLIVTGVLVGLKGRVALRAPRDTQVIE